MTGTNISELDGYFDIKPFVNDPSSPWLPARGSSPGWGSTSAEGSALA